MAEKEIAVEGATTQQEPAQPTSMLDILPRLDKAWWRIPYLLNLNLLLTVPMFTGYLVGFDGSMLTGMQAVPVWITDFDHPAGTRLAILSTMQSLGAIGSLPFAPFLTDRMGRRHPVFIGSIVCLLGVGLQAGAPNLSAFLAGRFFIGFGAGLVGNATPPLLAELSYPTHRSFITAFSATTWFIGAIVAAWTTYGTFSMSSSWSWRIPSLLQCVPSVYQVCLIYFVPESPRWLVGKGRINDARRVLNKWHAGQDTEQDVSVLVSHEMAEIEAAIELEKAQNTRSYLDFFATRGNRWRFILCVLLGIISQWAGNGLISYYLVVILDNIGITSAEKQNLINGLLTIFSWLVSMGGASTLLKWGRKRILLIGCAGMATAYLVWTIISSINAQSDYKNHGLGIGIVFMIFVFNFFYNVSLNPIQTTYILEILPFTLRAKGLMIMQLATYGAGLFNGYVNPIAMENIGWRYYIVYVVMLVVWFLCILFLFPETAGRTLEEVGEVFDGPNTSNQLYLATGAKEVKDATRHEEVV